MSEVVLYEIGVVIVLIGTLLYEMFNCLRRDRDLYRDLWQESNQKRMSELDAQLSPEAKKLDLAEFNATYDRSQLN